MTNMLPQPTITALVAIASVVKRTVEGASPVRRNAT
jgi:hypothetical protein